MYALYLTAAFPTIDYKIGVLTFFLSRNSLTFFQGSKMFFPLNIDYDFSSMWG